MRAEKRLDQIERQREDDDLGPLVRDVGEGLQVTQPAVNGAQMIERGAAAEVAALDERDCEAALRAVTRDGQTMDAAADDEDVERLSGEPIEIASHPQ